MKRLTKQAAARRLHKLASVAKIVKYDRAMRKLAATPVGTLRQKKSGGYKCARTWAEWAQQKMMGSVGQNPVTAPPKQNQPTPAVPNSSKYNRAGSFPRAIPTKRLPQQPVTGPVSQR